MEAIRFQQPDLRKADFDADKAAVWEQFHGLKFPYRPGKLVWVLHEDWEVLWTEAGERWNLALPRGWVTDLASVPVLLRWILDRVSMGEAAPLFHDVWYAFGGGPLPRGWLHLWAKGSWSLSERVVEKGWADDAFRMIQAADGRPGFVQWPSWLAVRSNLLAAWRWHQPEVEVARK